MYAVDRKHKKIISNTEFKHHGILGQKWGIITKNIGVNYVPIEERNRSGDSAPLSDDKRKRVDRTIYSSLHIYPPFESKLPDSFKNGFYKYVKNQSFC